jgi:hypothetical protein
MAIDNTPPRLKLIVTIAVITVVTLISLDFVFRSYYAMMTDEASREKVAPTRDKDDQLKAEQAALTNAAMPIDQAMAQIAKGQRPDIITPQPSEDLAPMTGWSKLPKPAPTPLPKSQPETPPSAMGDAGAATMTAGDGGAALHAPAAGDAGAPKPNNNAAKDAGATTAPHK